MNPFGQLIGQYNSSLPTLSDGDYAVISIDSSGRIIIVATDLDIRDLDATQDNIAISDGTDTLAINADGSLNVGSIVNDVNVTAANLDIRDLTHVSDSVKVGDGVDFLDILVWDAASAGTEKGILPFAIRNDAASSLVGTDGDFAPLQVDSLGRLKVAGTFVVEVDDIFESGTDGDASSDDAGDGVVPIVKVSMTDVVSIPITSGTYYILGMDVSSDKQSQYELIVDDNGTPSRWVRTGVLQAGNDWNKKYGRAIEITGQANRSIKLRMQTLQAANGNGMGAINGYTK